VTQGEASQASTFVYDSATDLEGAFFVVPVQLEYERRWYQWRQRPLVSTEPTANEDDTARSAPAIPAFTGTAQRKWDDVTDRGRVYPQHVLQAAYHDRWTIRPEHLGAKGVPPMIEGHPVIAVELWRFATPELRAALVKTTGDPERGRDALAVVHLHGHLSDTALAALTSRFNQRNMAKQVTRLLAPFASIPKERSNPDARPERNGRGPARIPGLAPLAGNALARAGDMPYVVSFAPHGDDLDTAIRLLHRPVPDPPPDGAGDVELARIGRAAAAYPDALGITYLEGPSAGYVAHVGKGWAIRAFLTDAVLLRMAQRTLFEDVGTLLHSVDATREPLAALRLHRTVLGHRARFWWPQIAREPWVATIDAKLVHAFQLDGMASEVFNETDQLAAEAEQGMTRLLTYLLAALAAVTVLVQVPLLLDRGGVLEYGALATTFGVLALVMATLVVRLRGGVFRRRPRL
jgi:hypothetical protein